MTESGYSDSYGNYLRVDGEEYSYVYAHLSELKVNTGDEIKQGETAALSGSTGQSTGPHLHFELYRDDELTDPESVLDMRNK